jgi:hypothetical protein
MWQAMAVGCALLSASSVYAQNLVLNGSFESGAFTGAYFGNTYLDAGSTAITGWTVVDSDIIWATNAASDSIAFNMFASEGEKLLDLTGFDNLPFGGVEQTIPTQPGLSYRMEFDLGTNPVRLGDTTTLIAQAGSSQSSFTFIGTGDSTQYQRYGLDFVAESSDTLIRFTGSTPSTVFVGLDNVVVSPIGPPKTISYGNFGPLPTGVTFLNVQESSGTDAIPLYGPPAPSSTGLSFNPAAFSAAGSDGDADVTDGQLNFTVMGPGINAVHLAENGDFALAGTGTTATQVAAGAIVQASVTQINGVNVAPIALAPNNSSAAFDLLTNPGAQQPWTLATNINVAGQLAALGYGANDHATKVDIAINNQLVALSEPAATAAISKRGFVITVDSRVPEPSAICLASMVLLAISVARKQAMGSGSRARRYEEGTHE